jgi:hypothetical protein
VKSVQPHRETLHHYLPNLTMHGEKLQTIITSSVTLKNVCTGFQPNRPLIAPAILPTANALPFAH